MMGRASELQYTLHGTQLILWFAVIAQIRFVLQMLGNFIIMSQPIIIFDLGQGLRNDLNRMWASGIGSPALPIGAGSLPRANQRGGCRSVLSHECAACWMGVDRGRVFGEGIKFSLIRFMRN
jgi:hypothetical protein